MNYSDISYVDVLSTVDEVNEYLSLGWKLINIYNKAYDTAYPGCNYQTAYYVMAWYSGEPQYPPPKYPDLGITL